MDGPVRLYWPALILNLWLVLASATQAQTPTAAGSVLRVKPASVKEQQQQALHEPSTLSLFRLSKASKCCTLTTDLKCKLDCTQGLNSLKVFEAKCTKLQEMGETCGEERELMSRKKLIIANLEGSCGAPLTVASTDQLWMCLLESGYFEEQPPNKNTDAIDGQSEARFRHKSKKYQSSLPNESMNPAKWLCCDRGQSQTCRQLCYRTLNNDWMDDWRHFSQLCLNSPSEMALRQCLDDAEAVCSFGCQASLKFCHYFNNLNGRRRGLVNFFRDCTVEADQAARNTYHWWLQQDAIHYSPALALHFKNQSKCQADVWKMLACTIHLKPCLPERHSAQICRSNCKQLVDECIDREQTIVSNQFDSGLFCDLITNQLANLSSTSASASAYSPLANTDTDLSCIDLKEYLNQSPAVRDSGATSTSGEPELIYNVCKKGSKCRTEQMCLRNQDCTRKHCPIHRCVNVCTIGKLNELRVPQDTFVSIPAMDAQNAPIDTLEESSNHHRDSCYNLCYCNANGELVDCKFYCLSQNRAEMAEEAEKAVLEQIECISRCPSTFQPICEYQTSQNYYSLCIRNCATKHRHFPLASRPRDNSSYWENNCGRVTDLQREAKIICPTEEIDERCTLEPGTQLVPLNADQLQLTRKVANSHHYPDAMHKLALEDEPLCDSHGEGHANLRSFHLLQQRDNVSFAHFGDCLNYCSLFSPVCGRDGADYQSECVAHWSHVLVDYFGGCHSRLPLTCPELKCPAHQFVHYLPLNRCPFCGSVAYFTYESNYFQHITSRADEHDIKQSLVQRGKLSVQALSQQLRDLVSVNTCDLFVHLLAENILVALMHPKFNENQQVALHQQTICQLELKRIVTLVKNQSPVLQLLLPLSLLRYNESIALRVAAISLNEDNGSASSSVPLTLHCITFVLVHNYVLYLVQKGFIS